MPVLKFDYVEPIPVQKVGNVIDPVITISVALGTVEGKYYDRLKRLDTGEEWVEYSRPVPFVIALDATGMQSMLGVVMQYAMAQGVLRMATPSIIFDAPPPEPVVTVHVEVVPSVANVAPGGTVQLAANVTNVPEGGTVEVTWFLRTGDQGSVDETGIYTAPTTSGTYRVLARSAQDPDIVGYCDVTVA